MPSAEATRKFLTKARKAAKEALSIVRPKGKDVLAVVCSDLHLSHKPPAARIIPEGLTWYDIQASYLRQLAGHAGRYKAPIFYAGDIFDKPNPSAECINFALEYLPQGYAVPGQHDMPYHNHHDINKSAYWTLCIARLLTDLKPGELYCIDEDTELYAMGFPWGWDLTPIKRNEHGTYLAVIHDYCWKEGFGYPDAPSNEYISTYEKQLRGFNAAVFGDNHKGFVVNKKEGTSIFNCGTFMRRKADEFYYTPQIGLLLSDGTFQSVPLDVSKDKFVRPDKLGTLLSDKNIDDFADFITELNDLYHKTFDFQELVKQYCAKKKVDDRIATIILQALEQDK